jgi:hypothetical protein
LKAGLMGSLARKKTKSPFNPGIFTGMQKSLFSDEEIATYHQDKYALAFHNFIVDTSLSKAQISKRVGITRDILQKLESGELKASAYWWREFWKLADPNPYNSGLLEGEN